MTIQGNFSDDRCLEILFHLCEKEFSTNSLNFIKCICLFNDKIDSNPHYDPKYVQLACKQIIEHFIEDINISSQSRKKLVNIFRQDEDTFKKEFSNTDEAKKIFDEVRRHGIESMVNRDTAKRLDQNFNDLQLKINKSHKRYEAWVEHWNGLDLTQEISSPDPNKLPPIEEA
ncbi:MAG: hypothetical protein GY874_13745 [Desulfobacteraceae bacterium]|nr:hypothetical protein [Desulfobacteraceae bacterium]